MLLCSTSHTGRQTNLVLRTLKVCGAEAHNFSHKDDSKNKSMKPPLSAHQPQNGQTLEPLIKKEERNQFNMGFTISE